MICPLHAWGDESIRSHGLDAPAYLLGASIVDTDDVPTTRESLLSLRGGARKLHWRDLDGRRRDQVTAAISGLRTDHVVVLAAPMALRRQERARSFCLRRLLWELDEHGVERLVLEARPRELMQRDVQLVNALRAQRAISPALRVEHGQPDQQPMLWLPDQVLGVVGESLTGDTRRLRGLGRRVRIVGITDADGIV